MATSRKSEPKLSLVEDVDNAATLPESPEAATAQEQVEQVTEANEEPKAPESSTVDFSDYEYVLAGDGPAELVELSLRLLKKPGDEFFWVDDRPGTYKDMALCPLRAGFNNEFYAVSRLVQEELGKRRVHMYRIRICYGRDTGLFLWALRMANPVFISNWHSTQWTIAEKGQSAWVSMEVDDAGVGYRILYSKANPAWPPPTLTAKPIDELIKLALGDRWINDTDHALLKHRRGEI